MGGSIVVNAPELLRGQREELLARKNRKEKKNGKDQD
jgi:hypothetical protein